MRWSRESGGPGALLVMIAGLTLPATAAGQGNAETRPNATAPAAGATRPAPADDNMKAIDDDYNQQRLRARAAAAGTPGSPGANGRIPPAAAATYEQIFRLAIAGNLFVDAGPIAEAVVKKGSPSPATSVLANLVKIIAEADRGAYEQSLESLRQAVAEAGKAADGGAAKFGILTNEKIGLLDAYYQRLVHADQLRSRPQGVPDPARSGPQSDRRGLRFQPAEAA